MSKNFDETVRLQSEKKQEWIRQIRGERLQGIAEGTSSAPRLASSSAVSFPGRNECPGTHYSLIDQEEREDSSCQICHRIGDNRKGGGENRVARTERESDRRRREEKRQTCWCCRDQQRACRMAQASTEKLENTGPTEKERVASMPRREQLASTLEPLLPKRKGQIRQSRVPDHEGGESQGERDLLLGKREGIREGAWRGKGELYSEGRFQGGKGGEARRTFLGKVQGSMSG